jgi:hypothetical protein
MKVVQGLLPNDYKLQVQEVLLGNSFPWNWNKGTVEPKDEKVFQLTHVFAFEDVIYSDYFNVVEPMFYYIKQSTGIEAKSSHRIKANLLPRQVCDDQDIAKLIHKDTGGDNHTSFIYYLHDVDGDIKTYDKDYKVTDQYEPKENSLVWFKSNTLHGTRPPIQEKRRVCINFVLETHD